MSHVVISQKKQYSPVILEGQADIVMGMEPSETLRILGKYGNPKVVTLLNPRPIYSVDVLSGDAEYPEMDKLVDMIKGLSAKTWIVNASDEAEKMGKPIVANTIFIGAMVSLGLLPLDREAMMVEFKDRFPKAFETNQQAFDLGARLLKAAV